MFTLVKQLIPIDVFLLYMLIVGILVHIREYEFINAVYIHGTTLKCKYKKKCNNLFLKAIAKSYCWAVLNIYYGPTMSLHI